MIDVRDDVHDDRAFHPRRPIKVPEYVKVSALTICLYRCVIETLWVEIDIGSEHASARIMSCKRGIGSHCVLLSQNLESTSISRWTCEDI